MPPSAPLTQDEIVIRVSRMMAREFLERELDKLNLPLPKEASLERHIDEILARNPSLVETARARVDAKQIAVGEIYAAMGGKDPAIDLSKAIDL